MRVLIIDDASATRLLLSKLLRSIVPGIEVSLCPNGKSALIMLTTEIKFDLVLLDLGLPDISGFDVLNFIESMEITSPVITISDHSNQSALAESVLKGAKAYVTKPIQKNTLRKAISEHASFQVTKSNKKKILIVDDEKTNRLLFKRHTELAGFEVIEATNGYEAIRATKHHSFDCILMDIRMPFMDGKEASRIILKEFPFVPIIVITGDPVDTAGDELIKIGVKAVLQKPILKDYLLASIDSQMELAHREFDNIVRSLPLETEPESKDRRIQEDFLKFVPKSFINPDDLKEKLHRGLRYEEDCTVVFIDIRKFTEMTEEMTASQTFNFLNSYFELVEPIVNNFGGMVYQFLGDGIVCTFPLFRGQYTNNAIHAAISIQDHITIYNRGRVRAGYQPISIGAGISTGPLAMGICGSQNRYEVGAFGSTMNIAARSQSACRDYGIDIVITSNTYDRIDDPSSMLIRTIGKHKLKGIKKELTLYEIFSHSHPIVRKSKSECLGLLSLFDPDLHDHDLESLASNYPEDSLWGNLKRLRSSLELL